MLLFRTSKPHIVTLPTVKRLKNAVEQLILPLKSTRWFIYYIICESQVTHHQNRKSHGKSPGSGSHRNNSSYKNFGRTNNKKSSGKKKILSNIKISELDKRPSVESIPDVLREIMSVNQSIGQVEQLQLQDTDNLKVGDRLDVDYALDKLSDGLSNEKFIESDPNVLEDIIDETTTGDRLDVEEPPPQGQGLATDSHPSSEQHTPCDPLEVVRHIFETSST